MEIIENTGIMHDLYTAVECQSVKQVEMILLSATRRRLKLNLNEFLGRHKMTALHLAVGHNSIDIVKLLIKHGANPNCVNCEGNLSPLHLSVLYDYEELVGVLVDAGGDPMIRDADKKNCLDYVVENDFTHLLVQLTGDRYRRSYNVRRSLSLANCSFVSQPPTQENASMSIVSEEAEPEATVTDSFFSCTSTSATSPDTKTPQIASNIVLTEVPAKIPTSTLATPKSYSSVLKTIPEDELGSSAISPQIASNDVLAERSTNISTALPATPRTYSSGLKTIPEDESGSEISSTASLSFSYSKEKGISDFSYLLTDDETRYGSIEEIPSSKFQLLSIKENVPEAPILPALPQGPLSPCPTPREIERLRETTKAMGLGLPVTASTYGVLSKLVNQASPAPVSATPKAANSSSTKTPATGSRTPSSAPLTAKNFSTPINSGFGMPLEKQGFSPELKYALRNLDIVLTWGSNLRVDMLSELQSHNSNLSPSRRASKSFFNYVLLDPHIIKRANFSGNQLKSDSITKNPDKFETFLRAVFYIGKGCGNRPLQHLVDAKKKLVLKKKLSAGEKLDKVLQIWSMGQGVIVHSVFHHSLEREANATEAAMIDAVGIKCESLTNLKKGSYDGTIASTWTQKTKNQYGSFLLYKTFCTFVMGDPKSFLPHDV